MNKDVYPEIYWVGQKSLFGFFHCTEKPKRIFWPTQYITQPGFPALKMPDNPPVQPPLPQSLATTDLFTISIILPFPECVTVEIIQRVAFSDEA